MFDKIKRAWNDWIGPNPYPPVEPVWACTICGTIFPASKVIEHMAKHDAGDGASS